MNNRVNTGVNPGVNTRRDRPGFVLPFVLAALTVIGLLALSFATVTLRDGMTVTHAAEAQRLSMTGDEAIARSLERWRQDSLWARELDMPFIRSQALTAYDRQTVTIIRSHPLIASVRAAVSHRDPRRSTPVRRELLHTVWLEPPIVALPAALTVQGDLSAVDPTLVSGIDLRTVGSPCGDRRDTLSVLALVADSIHEDLEIGTSWTLRPLDIGIGVSLPPADSSAGLWRIGAAAARLGTVQERTPLPASLDVAPASHPWHLLSLHGAAVHLAGVSRYHGLLVVDGDLVVEGALELQGLLWVRGRLDVQHGQLTVAGAVVVRGTSAPGQPALTQPVARLGSRTRIRFDRCLVQMALATVAEPRSAPFSLWNIGPP